jgi:hypothetical protein
MFPVNRHMVDDPTVKKYLNGYDGEYNDEFLPVEEFTVRKLPVECDERDVEPVDDNANDGKEGCKSHKSHVPVSDSKGEHETRKKHEDENLD